MPQSMNDEVLLVRDYIYETSGMYFPDSKRYFFESRFAHRLQELKLDSYHAYLRFLCTNSEGPKEYSRLIQEITINETSFFRNAAQFRAMVDLIVPEILKMKQKQGTNRLRIWSAGCSSGEEPYTIALFLLEYLKDKIRNWQVEILGTDIDPSVIEAAKRGIYTEYRLRNVPAEIRKRFFNTNHNGFAVNDNLKRLVNFRVSNLNNKRDNIPMRNFDIIFCRNVLIYFNTVSKKRVVENFCESLVNHGFFLLGHSESLFDVTEKFKLVHFPGGMAYKKAAGQDG